MSALCLLAAITANGGTICNNEWHGTSLCDGTFAGESVDLMRNSISGTLPNLSATPTRPHSSSFPSLLNRGSRPTVPAGTLPAELPASLTSLGLGSNSISGKLPAELPVSLTSLDLWHNAISGTLPAELPVSLAYQSLSYNSISGTLPAELPASLMSLWLSYNSISGTLPAELPASLTLLDLTNNNFRLPLPGAVSETCMAIPWCSGLPPQSCSAFGFGKTARHSAMQYGQCIACPDNLAPGIVLLVVTIVGCTLAIIVYCRLIAKYPNVQGWIATSSIIFSQLQLVAVIGLLSAIEGSMTHTVALGASLAFFDLSIASPECMMPQDAPMAVIMMSLIVGIPVVAIVVLKCHQRCNQHRQPEKADESANNAVILFTLLFSTVCKIWTNLLSVGSTVSFIPGCCLLLAHALYVLNLGRQTRMLRRLDEKEMCDEPGSTTSGGEACQCCLPRESGLCNRCRVCRGCVDCRCCLQTAAAVFCQAGCADFCSSEAASLSASRLRAQLSYLIGKFGDHAPFWQFVLWARVLFVQAVDSFTPNSMPLAKSGVIIGGILVFLAVHFRVQPYRSLFQNRLESGLLLANGLLTVLGMIYYVLRERAGHGVVDALLLVTLLGTPSMLLGLQLYWRLKRTQRQLTVDWGRVGGGRGGSPLGKGDETAALLGRVAALKPELGAYCEHEAKIRGDETKA